MLQQVAGNWESSAQRMSVEGAVSVGVVLTDSTTVAHLKTLSGDAGSHHSASNSANAKRPPADDRDRGLISRELFALALMRVGARTGHVGALLFDFKLMRWQLLAVSFCLLCLVSLHVLLGAVGCCAAF